MNFYFRLDSVFTAVHLKGELRFLFAFLCLFVLVQ